MLLVAQMLIKHSHMTDGAKSIAGHEVLAQVAAVYCLTVWTCTVAVRADQLSVNLHTQLASQVTPVVSQPLRANFQIAQGLDKVSA